MDYLNSLLSGGLGALLLFLIQLVYQHFQEKKKRKKVLLVLGQFLQNVILRALNNIITSYTNLDAEIAANIAGNGNQQVAFNDFNVLHSGYVAAPKFIDHIEDNGNADLQVLYFNLIELLETFKEKQPSNYMTEFGNFTFTKTDQELAFEAAKIRHQISLRIQAAQAGISFVNRIIEVLTTK
ncbi:MAG: hypothetical protein EOO47_25885 [Flavobacterium sp.]|nr:MAG: hypothetical protein EOO47_25885 [Flavobacterium sp.]